MREVDLSCPANVVIETTAHCQLRCAMCGRNTMKRKMGNMHPDMVRNILEQIAEWDRERIRVWYCFLGEPLILRRRLPEFIEYGSSLGIKNNIINTNGNLLDGETAQRLIDAGLTEIYIGMDAFGEETYRKIRVGGDFLRLMANIERLLQIRPPHLQITLQMIEMAANRHEKDAFVEYWKGRGVRTFIKQELSWIDRMDGAALTGSRPARYPCPWIVDTLGIYWNGDMPFCVNDWDGDTVFAHIHDRPMRQSWADMVHDYARAHVERDWEHIPDICKPCTDWMGKEERVVRGMPILREDAYAV